MTGRAEITRMALEVGAKMLPRLSNTPRSIEFDPGELEAFAALVEAAERARWAKVLDGRILPDPCKGEEEEINRAISECAAAIRANKDA